jgi:hypothetical protein
MKKDRNFTAEVNELLNQYWSAKIRAAMGVGPRFSFYDEDYIGGFNMVCHRLIEKRILTLKMLKDFLELK